MREASAFPRSSSHWIVVLALVVSLAAAPLVVLLSGASDSKARAVPFALVIITSVVILAYERLARRVNLVGVLGFAAITYSVMFGVVPLTDLWFEHPLIFHESWGRAAWLGWFGLITLYLGYRVALLVGPSVARGTARRWRARWSLLVGGLLLAAAAGMVIFELVHLGGPAAYWVNFTQRRALVLFPFVLVVLISLATPGILLIAGRWLSNPTRGRAAALFLFWAPLAILISGFTGSRWRILTIVVSLLGVYHLGRRRLPLAVVALLAIGLSLFFVRYGVERNYIGIPETSAPIGGENFYHNYLRKHDVGQFRDFVLTIDGVPKPIEFQGGATFLSIIPGLPFPTGGQVFSTAFFPALFENGASFPPTFPGELYMNWGIPGILLGMAGLGIALGLMQTYFERNRHRIGALLIYSLSLMTAAGVMRGDFTTIVGFYLAEVIPLAVALRIVERRIGPRDRVHHEESLAQA
jgi:hypothetical protein